MISLGKSEFNTSFNELSIGFFDFFLFYNAKPIIDMLSIDVEGSEFAIFQLLAGCLLFVIIRARIFIEIKSQNMAIKYWNKMAKYWQKLPKNAKILK